MPTVSGLEGIAPLRLNKVGLHLTNGTTSGVRIHGTGFSLQLQVTVRWGGTFDDPDVKWTGRLNLVGDLFKYGEATLTCANKYEPPDLAVGVDVGDPQDVTVTVGEGDNETEPITLQVNLDR